MTTSRNSRILGRITLAITSGHCECSAAIKIRMFAATIVLLLILVPSVHAKYSGGTGEPNNPYKIATSADLITLGNEPNDYDKYFIMIDDINLAGYVFDKAVIAPDMNDTEVWYQGTPFTGVFDGNDHTISHLTVQGNDYLGLFGQLGHWDAPVGEVKNLGVVDVNIVGSGIFVGGLVGYNIDGAVTECYSTGSVSGYSGVGGLVGGNDDTVAQCYSSGVVNGTGSVGGLVGYNDGSLTQCYSTGVVSGTWNIGGLMGENFGSVTQCYSTCAVDGNDNVGGLVGANWLGRLSNVTQCYSTGAVNGTWDVGGLVGLEGEICEPTRSSFWWCFWDTQTSGQTGSAGGIGKTTAEMKTKSTFTNANWDFVGETVNGTDDIWSICEGTNYPRLVWQIPKGDFLCPDGITIEEDFDFFFNHWGNSNCNQSNDYCNGTDLDLSGIVDFDDFLILLENWLKENP
jgi:hypothetical protein